MKRGVFCLAGYAAAALLSGCCDEVIPEVCSENGTDAVRFVRVGLVSDGYGSPADKTRSAVGDAVCDDGYIADANIFIYDDAGSLVHSEYMHGQSETNVGIPAGRQYYIYAYANSGKADAPACMDDLAGFRMRISDVGEMASSGSVPMCGKAVIDMTSAQEEVGIVLKRMVSEVVLSFRSDDDLRLELCSVEMENSPMDMAPFLASSEPLLRGSGDYATDDDLSELMDDGRVSLYLFEDMSSPNEMPVTDDGRLSGSLPENCPAVRIKGKVINSSGLVAASVDYWLALDWKLRRNHRYEIPFVATASGIHEDSWRVEVSDGELQISDHRIELPVNASAVLKVPAMEYSEVIFSSDNPEIAASDCFGNITACSPGLTVIRAYCPAVDASASCEVEVYSPDAFVEYTADLSEYARAWGRIDFMTADEDSPVLLVCGNDTLHVGVPSGGNMMRLHAASHDLYYVPDEAVSTVYVWNGKALGKTVLKVIQGRKEGEIVLENRIYPRYMLFTDEINEVSLSESGSKTDFKLYLADEAWDYLDSEPFFAPEEVCGHWEETVYDEFFWDYMDCIEISGPDGYEAYLDFRFTTSGWDDGDEDYLSAGEMWVMKSDETVPENFTLTLHNGANGFSAMPDTEVRVSVSKTFLRQGYMGEYYNFQIAPDDMHSDRILLDRSLLKDAQWEVRRFLAEDEGETMAETWANADDRFTGLLAGPFRDVETGRSYLSLLPPAELSADEFFANGSYIFRGRVVNPQSGQEICGYYTLDIILYVSVISSVDISISGLATSRVERTYVPLSRWSMPGYEDFWNNLYPVEIYDCETGYRYRLNSLVGGYAVDSFEIPGAISNPQQSYDTVYMALDGVFGKGPGDFEFCLIGGQHSVEELKIDRYTADMYNSWGYWHFVRQYDFGRRLENYIIEAYYHDFDTY